ncbi:hypothetical protein [Anabaena sp. CS-542/02]|uniref:hypothetical protein n=1 Tax=Anabaena sp. CS-542/02 TaxID=3021719 RepID=UPI00232DB8C8|nr:hypothetical protein [Anabaena sp. CS-542/02]MDB9445468.1 hypothetical protein [Anabaena sp. CS-542/02]
MIPIHEFSTGIEVERTPNGGWVSLGFTGKYMNCTLDPIPLVVERSIANLELFTLTKGASIDQPAIIGRVVETGEDSWVVMAVVTRAKDEKGRSLSLYRYFFTPGAYTCNLRYLLAWWESQGKPTFNPLDSKNIGQYAEFDPASAPSSDYDPTANDVELVPTKPTLLEPQQYNLTTVHTLAIRKHNLDKTQPISWAFNVKSLKKPRSFQIIQPAFLRAYENLEREISNPPPLPTDASADDIAPKKTLDKASTKKAIKAALQSLINFSQVKPPAVETIIDTLENQQLNTQEWYSLFDAEGASTAITEKIYSPPLARLMTLRAIVIPETLPEFLQWLNIQSGKQPSEAENTSLQFQGAICEYFPTEKLTAGIKLLIPQLLKEEISPESIKWLFIKGRVWDVCLSQFINDVRYDLQVIHQQSKTDIKNFDSLMFPLEIWQELIDGYNNELNLPAIARYLSLAQLFELLEDYKLCAYFYQVSQGYVPQKIFEIAFGYVETPTTFLGLEIHAETSLGEFFIKVARFKVAIAGVFSLLLLSSFGGYYLAGGFSPWREEMKTLESEAKNIEETEKVINNIVEKTGSEEENVIKKFNQVLTSQQTQNGQNTINNLNQPIDKLKSDIEILELYQKISAYHEVKTPTNPQKFNWPWSNQPDMRSTYQELEQKVSEQLKNEIINTALRNDNFNETMTALNKLMEELNISDDQDKSRLLKQVLGLQEDWNFSDIDSEDPNKRTAAKTQLVKAIYKYQQSPGLTADGIINNGQATYNRLKQNAQGRY